MVSIPVELLWWLPFELGISILCDKEFVIEVVMFLCEFILV